MKSYTTFLKEMYRGANQHVEGELVSEGMKEFPTISSLPNNHIAKQYLIKRKTPSKWFKYLYYTDNTNELLETYGFKKMGTSADTEGRIIIPFHAPNGKLSGFQARTLDPKVAIRYRYISKEIDKSVPRVFNLSRVKFNKPVLILEGPFDSMFLDNAIAAMGAEIPSKLGEIKFDNWIYVPDRDLSNPSIIRNLKSLLKKGYKISLLPKEVGEGKDINDYILSGTPAKTIQKMIMDNIIETEEDITTWK